MFASANNFATQIDIYLDRQLSRFLKKDYPFQPILLQEEVKKAIRANVKGFDDGSVLVPNYLQVEMNDGDYREAQKMGKVFHQKIHESAVKFINEEFPNAIADVSRFKISLSASPEVAKGSFVINAEYIEGNSPGTEERGT